MNSILRIRLDTTPDQNLKLKQLQLAFAEVCNALAPIVQRTRCWNRVALHHLAYRAMRQQFPQVGSQMVCNALYSVSRVSRFVYQHPDSLFNLQRLAGKPLPCLRFLPESPVYFDRHTLSLKQGAASMYTLDGRMRFNLPLAPDDELRFRTLRLREIVMLAKGDRFELQFSFQDPAASADDLEKPIVGANQDVSEYLLVLDGTPARADHATASQPLASALNS